MKTVNLGEKFGHRMTLRLNDDQMNYLVRISNVLGITPSEYVRMSINSSMVMSRKDLDKFENGEVITQQLDKQIEEVAGTYEDVKADINDKL